MSKYFNECVVVDCDHFFTSECLNQDHYLKHQPRERKARWQELAKVERKLTTRYSKSVVVTISKHETQGLAVKVKVVRSPIQHLREKLPSSLGKIGAK